MPGLILIVDDERDVVSNLKYNLEREGYDTRVAYTGGDAVSCATEEPVPDLMILDLMLPDLPGTEVCQKLRADERTRDVPVMMLTARGDEIDRVVGFEVGADDYVTKPFSVRELMLRVRSILRRSKPAEASVEELRFADLRVDLPGHRVWSGDEELQLTALEFRLLTTFLSRRGRVQTRDTLLADVWGIRADVTTRTVDTHVKRLREKLGDAGGYIETVRGVGYRFRASAEEASA